MARRHGDPVQVVRRDDEPHQFLWRDRLYVVRAVLDRWVEARRWWQAPAVRTLSAAGAVGGDEQQPPLQLTQIAPSPRWGQRAWGEPAPDLGAGVGAGIGLIGVGDEEEEIWRVEAAAGRAAATGVYDLALRPATGEWTLRRVVD